jgi:hypothetical protein
MVIALPDIVISEFGAPIVIGIILLKNKKNIFKIANAG